MRPAATWAQLWTRKVVVVSSRFFIIMGSTDEHVPAEEALNVVRCHAISAALYLFRSQAKSST